MKSKAVHPQDFSIVKIGKDLTLVEMERFELSCFIKITYRKQTLLMCKYTKKILNCYN